MSRENLNTLANYVEYEVEDQQYDQNTLGQFTDVSEDGTRHILTDTSHACLLGHASMLWPEKFRLKKLSFLNGCYLEAYSDGCWHSIALHNMNSINNVPVLEHFGVNASEGAALFGCDTTQPTRQEKIAQLREYAAK